MNRRGLRQSSRQFTVLQFLGALGRP